MSRSSISFFDDYFYGNNRMNASIDEVDNNYLISFDLVGVKKGDIELTIEKGILSLKAERKKGDKVIKSYNSSFYVPKDISTEPVSTKYEDGVLELTFAKDKTHSHRILIE